MNTTELKQFLTDNIANEIARDFFGENFPYNESSLKYHDEESESVAFYYELQKNGIEVEGVEQHGGEGEGDQYWWIVSFTKADAKVYVKFDGWYQSYNGSEFTDWFFVEPKEVVVTEYQKVE